MRHPQKSLNNLLVAVSLIAIVSSLFLPEMMLAIAPFLLFISVVLIGIPHGAIDHIVAADIYGFQKRLQDHLVFYSSYLLVMLLVGLLWIFFPLAGMIFFLLISIYHFGQADMMALMKGKTALSQSFAWIRGVMIIGLIIFPHADISLPIIEAAIRTSPDWFSVLYENALSISIFIVAAYLTLTLIASQVEKLNLLPKRFLLESLLLMGLLLFTHPLIGFAIYFALWHSAGHVIEMMDFFRSKGRSLKIIGFYKLALPFTIISLVGLVLLFYLQQALAIGEEMISLLFILISVLTLPHMFVVDQMFKKKEQI